MFNQMFLSIGRKLSAHLFTTCIFCILILIVLIGGLIQVISSVAFSAYLENSNDQQLQQQQEMTISTAAVTTSPYTVYQSFDGSSVVEQMYDVTRHNKKNGSAFGKGIANSVGDPNSNGNRASGSSMKSDRADKQRDGDGARGFLSTKILYKPYMVTSNEQYNQLDKSPISSSSSLTTNGGSGGGKGSNGSGKSKTINLTVYKSVTPSITDRVIADLKKEEYLAQQRTKTNIDSDENEEAIYIDGDDDSDDDDDNLNVRRRNFTADIETSIEKLPTTNVAATADDDDDVRASAKVKTNPKSKPNGSAQTIGMRDKKSSKKPIIITQKSFDETLNINDDDDYDDYVNSGSGDFSSSSNSHLNERETDPDWVPPSIGKIKAKKMNKQEQIMKSFAENSYGDGIIDVSKEAFDGVDGDDGGIDGIDFIDKDDDQMISQKIAKATATNKKKQQKANANGNQKLKPKLKSKPKSNKSKQQQQQPLTNRQKANNKRKSKEQQYIEEYFSGTKTNTNGNSDSGSEAELIKVCAGFILLFSRWKQIFPTNIHRIFGTISILKCILITFIEWLDGAKNSPDSREY